MIGMMSITSLMILVMICTDVGNIMYNPLGDQFVYIWNEYVQAPPTRSNGWDEIFQEITEHGPCEDEGNLLIFLSL
ncbi:hypothetical protein SLA2020_277380 [Shorea laevis]